MAEMQITAVVNPVINQNAFAQAGIQGGNILAAQLNRSFGKIQPLGRITGQVSEFEKSMEAANARVLAFGASAGGIYLVQSAVQKLITSTIAVEKSLADINVVLGMGNAALKSFSKEMFNAASQTGQTFETASKVALEFARHGVSATETANRMTAAMQLMRVAGLDAKSAVDAITASINAFSREGISAADVVNRLAAVDTKFAVSAQDLAKAVERVGSVAEDAGIQFNQLLGLVTAAQTITARGGAVIGNAFKSIFTRLSRPQVLDDLQAIGVETRNASGQIRPMIDILKSLAQAYDKLGSNQKSFIAESVGGVYQVNILKAQLSDLGNSLSIYEKATLAASLSTGAMEKRMAMLNETISSKLNTSSVQLIKLFSQFGQLSFGDSAKSGLDAFNQVIKNISSYLDAFDEKNDTVGEKFGKTLASGVAKGIGGIVSGPLTQIATVLLGTITARTAKFGIDAAKGFIFDNSSIAKRKALESDIQAFLSGQPALLQAIQSGQTSINDATAIYLVHLKAVTAQQKILTQMGAAAFPLTAVTSIKKSAAGFVPNYSAEENAEKMAAFAHGYKAGPVIKKTLHDGRGNAFVSMINQAESTKRFINSDGYIADIVRPPNGFGKDTTYAGGGFIPNYSRIVGKGPNLFVSSLYDSLSGEFGGGPEYPFVRPGKGAAFLDQTKISDMIKLISPFIRGGGDVIFGPMVGKLGGDLGLMQGLAGNRLIHDELNRLYPNLKKKFINEGSSTENLTLMFKKYKNVLGLKRMREIMHPFIEPDILAAHKADRELGMNVSRLTTLNENSLSPVDSGHDLYKHAIGGAALGRINPVSIKKLFTQAGNLSQENLKKLLGIPLVAKLPIGIAYERGDETHKMLGLDKLGMASGFVPNFARNIAKGGSNLTISDGKLKVGYLNNSSDENVFVSLLRALKGGEFNHIDAGPIIGPQVPHLIMRLKDMLPSLRQKYSTVPKNISISGTFSPQNLVSKAVEQKLKDIEKEVPSEIHEKLFLEYLQKNQLKTEVNEYGSISFLRNQPRFEGDVADIVMPGTGETMFGMLNATRMKKLYKNLAPDVPFKTIFEKQKKTSPGDITEEDFINLKKALKFMVGPKGKNIDFYNKRSGGFIDLTQVFPNGLAGGFVPNYSSGIRDAYNREYSALAARGFDPEGLIYGAQTNIGPAIFNKVDEPNAASRNLAVATRGATAGRVPNYAIDTSVMLGALQYFMMQRGGPSSMDFGSNSQFNQTQKIYERLDRLINTMQNSSSGSVQFEGRLYKNINNLTKAFSDSVNANRTTLIDFSQAGRQSFAQQYSAYTERVEQNKQRIQKYSMVGAAVSPIVGEVASSFAGAYGASPDAAKGISTLGQGAQEASQALMAMPNAIGAGLAIFLGLNKVGDAIVNFKSNTETLSRTYDLEKTKLEKLTGAINLAQQSFDALDSLYRSGNGTLEQTISLQTKLAQSLGEIIAISPQIAEKMRTAKTPEQKQAVFAEARSEQEAKTSAIESEVSYRNLVDSQKKKQGWFSNLLGIDSYKSAPQGHFTPTSKEEITKMKGEKQAQAVQMQDEVLLQLKEQSKKGGSEGKAATEIIDRYRKSMITTKDVETIMGMTGNTPTAQRMDNVDKGEVQNALRDLLSKIAIPADKLDEFKRLNEELINIRSAESSIRKLYNQTLISMMNKGSSISEFNNQKALQSLTQSGRDSSLKYTRQQANIDLMSLVSSDVDVIKAQGEMNQNRIVNEGMLKVQEIKAKRGTEIGSTLGGIINSFSASKLSETDAQGIIPVPSEIQLKRSEYLAERQSIFSGEEGLARLFENSKSMTPSAFAESYLGGDKGREVLGKERYEDLASQISAQMSSDPERKANSQSLVDILNTLQESDKNRKEEAAKTEQAIKAAQFKELANALGGLSLLEKGGARKMRREIRKAEYLSNYGRTDLQRARGAATLLQLIPESQRDVRNPYVSNLYGKVQAGFASANRQVLSGTGLAQFFDINKTAYAQTFGNIKAAGLSNEDRQRQGLAVGGVDMSPLSDAVARAKQDLDFFGQSLRELGSNLPDILAKKQVLEKKEEENKTAQNQILPPVTPKSENTNLTSEQKSFSWKQSLSKWGQTIPIAIGGALLLRGLLKGRSRVMPAAKPGTGVPGLGAKPGAGVSGAVASAAVSGAADIAASALDRQSNVAGRKIGVLDGLTRANKRVAASDIAQAIAAEKTAASLAKKTVAIEKTANAGAKMAKTLNQDFLSKMGNLSKVKTHTNPEQSATFKQLIGQMNKGQFTQFSKELDALGLGKGAGASIRKRLAQGGKLTAQEANAILKTGKFQNIFTEMTSGAKVSGSTIGKYALPAGMSFEQSMASAKAFGSMKTPGQVARAAGGLNIKGLQAGEKFFYDNVKFALPEGKGEAETVKKMFSSAFKRGISGEQMLSEFTRRGMTPGPIPTSQLFKQNMRLPTIPSLKESQVLPTIEEALSKSKTGFSASRALLNKKAGSLLSTSVGNAASGLGRGALSLGRGALSLGRGAARLGMGALGGGVLGLGLGAYFGSQEAAEQGESRAEGAILGALSGGYSKGSVFGKMGLVKQGGASDVLLGFAGAGLSGAATGAAIGGSIGALFGGVGAAPGAAIGGLIGGGVGLAAEGYKYGKNWYVKKTTGIDVEKEQIKGQILDQRLSSMNVSKYGQDYEESRQRVQEMNKALEEAGDDGEISADTMQKYGVTDRTELEKRIKQERDFQGSRIKEVKEQKQHEAHKKEQETSGIYDLRTGISREEYSKSLAGIEEGKGYDMIAGKNSQQLQDLVKTSTSGDLGMIASKFGKKSEEGQRSLFSAALHTGDEKQLDKLVQGGVIDKDFLSKNKTIGLGAAVTGSMLGKMINVSSDKGITDSINSSGGLAQMRKLLGNTKGLTAEKLTSLGITGASQAKILSEGASGFDMNALKQVRQNLKQEDGMVNFRKMFADKKNAPQETVRQDLVPNAEKSDNKTRKPDSKTSESQDSKSNPEMEKVIKQLAEATAKIAELQKNASAATSGAPTAAPTTSQEIKIQDGTLNIVLDLSQLSQQVKTQVHAAVNNTPLPSSVAKPAFTT